jgi:hypothetical protein
MAAEEPQQTDGASEEGTKGATKQMEEEAVREVVRGVMLAVVKRGALARSQSFSSEHSGHTPPGSGTVAPKLSSEHHNFVCGLPSFPRTPQSQSIPLPVLCRHENVG